MSNINFLANGIGFLYIEDLDGNLVNPGIPNTPSGARQVMEHALVSAPIGYTISAQGSIEFAVIGVADNVLSVTIDGVQVTEPGVPIPIGAGLEEDAATAVAIAINNYIPVSGFKYKAIASGNTVYLQAPTEAGATVNGDVVLVSTGFPASHTINIENIDNGSTGNELVSPTTGFNYYLNATTDAVLGDIAIPGTENINEYIIGRFNNMQTPSFVQQIASESILDLTRYSQWQVLNLDASGATDLNTITGNFTLNDVLLVYNSSPFTVTINDSVTSGGNLKLSPSQFVMPNENYVIWLTYVDDSVYGRIWQEFCRHPFVPGADSITDIELADNAVDTLAVQNDAITTPKIQNGAITAPKMAADAILTGNIINDAVTTPKVANDAITEPKVAANAISELKIQDDAVTNPKIADGAVNAEKLDAAINVVSFTMPISWEAGYQGIVKRRIPWNMIVTEVFLSVSKDTAPTDDATLITKNDVGTALVNGQIDVSPSVPIGNDFTTSPTDENVFLAGEAMQFETQKLTPGGEAVVTVVGTLYTP